MQESQKRPNLTYNQTPVRAEEFLSSPEMAAEVATARREHTQGRLRELSPEQEIVVEQARRDLEKVSYPSEIVNLGQRVEKLRGTVPVYGW